jgi:hypothetical protein
MIMGNRKVSQVSLTAPTVNQDVLLVPRRLANTRLTYPSPARLSTLFPCPKVLVDVIGPESSFPGVGGDEGMAWDVAVGVMLSSLSYHGNVHVKQVSRTRR